MSVRLLAMGVCDSIAHCTGVVPRPDRSGLHAAATLASYAVGLLIGAAVLAYIGARA